MIWRFRLRGKAPDSGPIGEDVRGPTQQQFHAWAAAVRASMEAIQALAEEMREKDRALEELLRSPTKPDPAAIERLIVELQARRTEINRIIDALPALDEMGEAGKAGRPGAPPSGKGRYAIPSR